MADVALITPTGDRPRSFALLERMVARMVDPPDFEWIVADDGETPTEMTMGQTYIRGAPVHGNTFEAGLDPRGMRGSTQWFQTHRLLDAVKSDKVIELEDDDWYSPDYLRIMDVALDTWGFVGEGRCRYYNVACRKHFTHGPIHHASWANTSFRMEFVDEVRSVCAPDVWAGDCLIWGRIPERRSKLLNSWNYVGIKGMPGRAAVTGAHAKHGIMPGGDWQDDPDMTTLRTWVGDDARWYEEFGNGADRG